MTRTSAKARDAVEGPLHPNRPIPTAPAPNVPETLTKKARLISLLRQTDGANLASISAELGWLPHTTRAAITGLRKAGHQIETRTSDGGTAYRITTEPPAPTVGTTVE